MCNDVAWYPTDNPLRIPLTGEGYKIFMFEPENEAFSPLLHQRASKLYHLKVGERIVWSDKVFFNTSEPLYGERGFCFFLTYQEAERALRGWKGTRVAKFNDCYDRNRSITIQRIAYSGGLQEREESGFIANLVFRMALCKEFTSLPPEITD